MTKSWVMRRVIALTIALLIVTPISVVAARWQWNRHIERDTRNELISHNAVMNYAHLLDSIQESVLPNQEWRTFDITGHFVSSEQKLWRKQPLNGEPGFIEITPFVTADNSRILVARGWVAADGRNPASDVNLDIAEVHQTIVVRARLLANDDDPDPSDLPAGQTNSPTTLLTSSTINGLFELVQSETSQSLTALPLPELEAGPHLGYVGQWIIIGISAIVIYVMVLRRLRIEHQASVTKSA